MGLYKQLSYEERTKIAQLKLSSLSIGKIALEMGRSKSSISRELWRNSRPPGEYWPDTAQAKALERRKRGSIIDREPALKEFILNQLQCHYWTPEQIAGYLKTRQSELPYVCHETIYAWIYDKPQKKEKLWKFLPRHKAKRGPRKSNGAGQGRIPDRVSIHERPQIVDQKIEFGHWEGDLMAFLKNSQHILVIRERKTMYTMSTPLETKKATKTSKSLLKLIKKIPESARKTITYDNGGEFADHKTVTIKSGIKAYFCDPYASWQKGGIENTNGRLRRDLPRKVNIKSMNQEDFDEVIFNYNSTPRKKLGWLTPLEAFAKNLQSVALQT